MKSITHLYRIFHTFQGFLCYGMRVWRWWVPVGVLSILLVFDGHPHPSKTRPYLLVLCWGGLLLYAKILMIPDETPPTYLSPKIINSIQILVGNTLKNNEPRFVDRILFLGER